MANTIKFKRASGSDPSASDLAIGEPGLRTDTAELFFKKDDGTVAKVSGGGGGPNFKYLELRNAANNGAASFPGNDFTLVTAGTTTAISPAAANTLIVSVSGVIQKPNSGTSTSGISGFIVDGSRFKTATNLPAAPDFIVYQESGGIGEPSDNTVTSAKIVDGAIVNADINASAAIAGSKIDPTFTSTVNVTNNLPEIFLTDSNSSNARARINANGGGLLLGADNDNAHADSSINFEVDGSTKMSIDSSGNVGIGTTSPTINVHVQSSGTNSLLKLAGTSAGSGINDGLDVGINGVDGILWNRENGPIQFATNNSERMRLDSDGRLGIGVTTFNSSNRLRILESIGNGRTIEIVANSTGGVGSQPGIQFTAPNGDNIGNIFGDTSTDKLIIQTGGTARITLDNAGNAGVGTLSPASTLHTSSSGDHVVTFQTTTSGADVRLNFRNDSGTDAGGIHYLLNGNALKFITNSGERFKIDGNGHFGFGPHGIDPSGNGGITIRQTVVSGNNKGAVISNNTIDSGQGFQEFRSSGTQIGSIGKSGTTSTTYNTSSDYRLKENESSITDGITRLKILKPYRFNWKADASTRVDGFFAHEVTPAVPEAITGTKDEVDENNKPIYQQIDQSKLVPLLVAALQEAIGRIEALEAK